MEPLALFAVLFRASVLSVGGLGALPLLHQDLVAPGHATEQHFIEAIAIGRVSTGPSGLYIVSIGYFVMGWLGAAIAFLAVLLPPLAIVPAAAIMRRQLLSGWFAGLVRGVALSTSGLVLATAIGLVSPGVPLTSTPAWQVVLALAAGAATVHGKVHPALLLAIGAGSGLALAR